MVRAPLRTHDRSAPSRGTPALASLGLARELGAPLRRATVMGTSTDYAWCDAGDDVVFLAGLGAVRFPNAVLADAQWGRLERGEEILIGGGSVVTPMGDYRVVRWWDPTVTARPATGDCVRAAVERLDHASTPPSMDELQTALVSGDRSDVLAFATSLLGFGCGLTPEGDDHLIGAFAAFNHLTSSLGRPEASHGLRAQADELVAMASTRTTKLSVTLLRHALAGRVADPVADLLRAIAGRCEPRAAVVRCFAMGGSSGRALAHGVLAGARAACQVAL